MQVKIGEIHGYQVNYDTSRQYFLVIDTDGTELASAGTQERIEAKAKSLSKQEFKRIPIVFVNSNGRIQAGQITSFDPDDKAAWVSMENTKGRRDGGRQKVNFAYGGGGYYELTPVNTKIIERIISKVATIEQEQLELKSIIATLEKPINLGYFKEEK